MSGRSAALYRAMWITIMELVPGLNITIFTCDFEAAAIVAVRESFPNARIVGCWWHYVHVRHQIFLYIYKKKLIN